jgi:hypothetical protein
MFVNFLSNRRSSVPRVKENPAFRSNAEQVYLKSLGDPAVRRRARDFDRLDEAGRAAVFDDAVSLVRLVDAFYIAGDRRAHEWAVHFDDYEALLRSRADELSRHALHSETKAAIEEARGLALKNAGPTAQGR